MASQKQERIFITGGSGYVGSVVTELAVADNYAVHALSRTEASDAKLLALGATPIRGDLTSLDVLRTESAAADIVLHLATAYTLGVGTYEDVRAIDFAAVDAIADGLEGSNKPLVTTTGTLTVADAAGAETNEDSPADPNPPMTRGKTEQHSLALASRGIRVTSLRLAQYVYGRGGSGVALYMGMAAQAGSIATIDGGGNRFTAVHVDDAAWLYLLVAQKAAAGEIINASTATDITTRELLGAVAQAMGVPLRDITREEALAQVGETFTWFLTAVNRASGAKAREVLGWKPSGVGILEEISKGSYQALAESLRKVPA